MALIGDSHASHWRAAVAVIAARKRWRGLSMTHSGCPFSKATKVLRQPALSQCLAWNRDVLRFLHRHREVKTVFVSEVSGGAGFHPSHGRDAFGAAVAGYAAAWRALPRSGRAGVRHPRHAEGAPGNRLLRPGGAAPAPPGRSGLRPPTTQRPRRRPRGGRGGSPRAARVQGVDLTRFICDTRRCFPVVGGALVYKDEHHLTTVFATTLGPYLQRAVDEVMSARDPTG